MALLSACVGYRTPLDEADRPDAKVDTHLGCTPDTVTLSRARPTVMFVLDRSTSMATRMNNGRGAQTRWEALASALSTVLPPVDKSLAIGALLFPDLSTSTPNCSVPTQAELPPATGNVTNLTRLMNAYPPDGSTPTASAIDVAARYLLSLRTATTARALVLATDGGPDCNAGLNPRTCHCLTTTGNSGCASTLQCLDDDRTVQTIAGYHEQGLPTYVIGLGNQGDAELDDALNAMAIAGGRPQRDGGPSFYPTSSSEDLNAALSAIRDQVGACTYLTSAIPDHDGAMVIHQGGAEIPPEQWTWGDKSNGEILLLGDACQALSNSQPSALTATLACTDD
jgi:hypothetical protein